ncbi:MAG: Adenylate kinase [Candidatus Yanofskybacteria bacterium GW2011_GWA1_39_13]|uniref:Adenylate kinase n=1 Tax=Yanofskybacteria sp. (strain GW2011_GWA1_39_13) TaxID=1619019 RepID=A0A0G0MPJ5_YANXG|nr:MAG: Adenylate kinase [Candidatus Yanofskybacteria bacterium GW2011_GWA1_39_13]
MALFLIEMEFQICYDCFMNKTSVIVLVGPPGAGKGTQADLLAEDFGFLHFETSKIIEGKFNNAGAGDVEMANQYEMFKSGKLNDPKLVRAWVVEEIEKIGKEKKSIVFSSSPRTIFEAEGEMPLLESLYGKENIFAVNIEVSEEESMKRNSNRRICKANRHPIPNFPEFVGIETCPKDGSEIVTRVLDNPETIKVRYATYLEETKPVLDFLEERGYKIIGINGDQPINAVHDDIMNELHEEHASNHKDILNNLNG